MWRAFFGILAVGCGSVHGSEPSTADAADTPLLAPSNGDVIGGLQPTALTLSLGTAMFDTGAECTATAAVGVCAVVPRDGLAEICVCRVDTLTIDTLHVHGPRALAILAWDTVTVHTLVDVSANGATPGPGATRPQTGAESAGASFGTLGGTSAILTHKPGDLYGTPDLIPLEGGMVGSQAGDGQTRIVLGGGGGGAIQITAGNRIDVLGAIVAGGGGGMPNLPTWGTGAGGGSGGAILLESRVISIVGSVAANGGGGGGSAGLSGAGSIDTVGGVGFDGGHDATAALGGHGGVGSCATGGVGGSGSSGDGGGAVGHNGSGSCSGTSPGTSGGGGGAGRIRINSETGCACSGKLTPTPSFGQIVTR